MQPLPQSPPCVDSARGKTEEDMNGTSLLVLIVPLLQGVNLFRLAALCAALGAAQKQDYK